MGYHISSSSELYEIMCHFVIDVMDILTWGILNFYKDLVSRCDKTKCFTYQLKVTF